MAQTSQAIELTECSWAVSCIAMLVEEIHGIPTGAAYFATLLIVAI